MTDSSSNSVFKGALMTVLMRWTDRLIGFISTLILARVLVPEDFGVIAMASLVVGLLDVLLDLGVNVALIQNRTPSQAHYDSAWTLRLAQAATTALLIVIASPFAGDYFNDPRVTPVLQFMALSLFVAGLENIGTITFQKEMRFDLEYRFNFSKRIVAFLVTVTSAWLLHSYWALVFGTLAGRIFGVFLSYRMVAMRPRLCTEKMREIKFKHLIWPLDEDKAAAESARGRLRTRGDKKRDDEEERDGDESDDPAAACGWFERN